ncbi:terminase small subunit [Sinorhizobium meliloti]|nr:terminase small subunit [Sinorhizobium meliloti]MDW9846927.1 terminase small subunit [Sinorhizobium meliloti]MDX0143731.1 terminase small subunit [Sinorhizobium meliloti]MDX0149756.1 terminase small subunit [Sinorhizobium meliloti]MDX0168969.1 terminase small subunit [Sinorhizobium meliloti]
MAAGTEEWENELTAKQRAFVREYLVDLNATQAAIRAGYSAKTAKEQGARLLTNVHVAAAVAAAMQLRAKRTEITADRVLQELAKIGFSDIRKAVKWQSSLITEEDNPEGGDIAVVKTVVTNNVQLVASDELDDETAAAISEISQNATGGLKVKFHDKRAALVDIGKHLGMFTEKHEVTGKDGGPIQVESLSENEVARRVAFMLAKGVKAKAKPDESE